MSPPAGQDVNDGWSFQHPELYVPGQLNLYFSKKAFFKCALHGGYSSLVLFFIPYAALYDTMRDDGKDIADYQSFALLTQTCLLFTVSIQVCWLILIGSFIFKEWKEQLHIFFNLISYCLQLGLEMSYWTAVNTLFVLGSLAMYFVVTFTMNSNGSFLLLPRAFAFIGERSNTNKAPQRKLLCN